MLKPTWVLLYLVGSLFLSACGSPQAETSPPTPDFDRSGEVSEAPKAWKDGFLAHWWREVPRKDAKSWEILPQDAGPGEVILSKRHELGLMSNFAETPFVFKGRCYPTIEAFWQMMKYPENQQDERFTWVPGWKFTRDQVSQFSGYKAKSAGHYANQLMDDHDANWVTFEGHKIIFASMERGEHYQLIWQASVEKLRQNPEVLKVLLATKNLKLRPDHRISEQAPDEWHYNQVWTDLRDRVQKEELDLKTSENLKLRTCKGL